MSDVHVVLPRGVDDPARPSGGNRYDREVCAGLVAAGWEVHEHYVPGPWPTPDRPALADLSAVLAAVPDDRVVLVDGLAASPGGEALVRHAARLRLVVLVHLPLAVGGPAHSVIADAECAVLRSAVAVLTTSDWTRDWLVRRYQLSVERVHVAEPGVAQTAVAKGTALGTHLLCVAAVRHGKGHDLLVRALESLDDLPWSCVCVGALDLEPEFVHTLERQRDERGLTDRLRFTGPLVGADLEARYAAADLLVLPSRGETYGMVVTEALARGLPVVATAVGGIPTTTGMVAGGARPGLLVPPEDPDALAAALRCWLEDEGLRQRLRRRALERRQTLESWSVTAERVGRVLDAVARGSVEPNT